MTRPVLSVPVLAVVLILLVPPAAASVVLSDVLFTPAAPLVPAGKEQVVATCAVIPSGSTTFQRGHSLQMQTGLEQARWTIQVTLDGRDAARQTASGSAAFVNGEILSYPTDRDVGIVVTVDGMVPANATGTFTVLTVGELDNAGSTVPGSTVTISQPVAGPVQVPATSAMPTLTLPPVTPTPAAKSPGFGAPFALAALAAACMIPVVMYRRQ